MNEKSNTSTWKDYESEGRRYVEISKRAINKPEKFSPEIIYNMACMGIEKLFMAYFLKENVLPHNHTILDLVTYMKSHKGIPQDLEDDLLKMNNFQEICSLETYSRSIPTPDDLGLFIDTLERTETFINSVL